MARNQLVNDEQETLDKICGELEVFQARRGYRFGIETLLLAGFVGHGAERLLDLGTGSAVLPMVLVHFGKAKSALGVEIQPRLAARACRSVEHNGLEKAIEIKTGDIRLLEQFVEPSSFDLVVSNPPYGKTGKGNTNPDGEKAIARHELLVKLSEVIRAGARAVKVRGKFCMVIPPTRLAETLTCCMEQRLRLSRLRLVHGRRKLAAKHCLIESVRQGKMDLVVEPPLIIYDEKGNYTDEVKSMLYPGMARTHQE